MSGIERDPRIDPVPGDWLTNKVIDVRIDQVLGDQVYFARFWSNSEDELTLGLYRLSLSDFRRLAKDAAVMAMSHR